MQDFLTHFEAKGFYVFPSYIENETAEGIRAEIERLREQELFKKAGIGRESNFQIDQAQRGDFIHWIEPLTASADTNVFLGKLQELVTELNRNFYLGIRGFECHYTQYPEGTFYKRHTDRHKNVSHRIVSFVLYLNENWRLEEGGILRIYHEDESHDDVWPQNGTLAIFLSEKEHEVLPTSRTRQSITGWMRNNEVI